MDKLIVEIIKAKKELDFFYSIRGFLLRITLTFSRLTLIPSILIINLRYFMRFTPNLHFLILIYRPVFRSLSRTFLT